MKVHLDTHAVVWFYTGELKKFNKSLLSKLQTADLFISPPVMFELAMIHQIGKIRDNEDKIFRTLQQEINLELDPIDSRFLFEKACSITWTRDPFDRMIVAGAAVQKVPLVTRDLHIQDFYKKTLW